MESSATWGGNERENVETSQTPAIVIGGLLTHASPDLPPYIYFQYQSSIWSAYGPTWGSEETKFSDRLLLSGRVRSHVTVYRDWISQVHYGGHRQDTYLLFPGQRLLLVPVCLPTSGWVNVCMCNLLQDVSSRKELIMRYKTVFLTRFRDQEDRPHFGNILHDEARDHDYLMKAHAVIFLAHWNSFIYDH